MLTAAGTGARENDPVTNLLASRQPHLCGWVRTVHTSPRERSGELSQFWSGSHRFAAKASPAKFSPEQIIQPVPTVSLPCLPLII